ncbi:MAG TPA: carboxypeptidase-like regulatory domain-containing protein, partial [Dyadobacter sp.]|nr:carboxypeptidase-like regulatory domain-containing protein [Dyadobacter sp.]
MIRILFLILICSSLSFAQAFNSTIRGTVKDADSGLPLEGATVKLLPGAEGTVSSSDGGFRFNGLQPGRYQLVISYVGFKTVTIPEILLESGKENVNQYRLSSSNTDLQEATVSGSPSLAVNSVQSITVEQTYRYAATYMDPARVATSFPGVAAANDQANGLVVRGNSPNSMQWRLEGLEIVNPNHLSNAGTFSDRPTSTGGGVNILSTQLLATSNFLSGPFPAQYGNVTGAVLDMNLRKGNDEQTEFTAQASLIGFDFAVEGPLSKKSKASYLINYRYSFTGLLGSMGVDFGGEKINFQDLSFNLNFPTVKGGKFTVFGMGGDSKNVFSSDKDTTTWEFDKDGRNILYKNRMGAAGATFDQPLNDKASLRMAVVASGLTTSRDAFEISPLTLQRSEQIGSDELVNNKISFNTRLNYRLNAKSKFSGGFFVTTQKYDLNIAYPEANVKSWFVQPFVTWSYQLAPSLT